jgi:hypothetical protein
VIETCEPFGYLFDSFEYSIDPIVFFIGRVEYPTERVKYSIESLHYSTDPIEYSIRPAEYCIGSLKYLVDRVGYSIGSFEYSIEPFRYPFESPGYRAGRDSSIFMATDGFTSRQAAGHDGCRDDTSDASAEDGHDATSTHPSGRVLVLARCRLGVQRGRQRHKPVGGGRGSEFVDERWLGWQQRDQQLEQRCELRRWHRLRREQLRWLQYIRRELQWLELQQLGRG